MFAKFRKTKIFYPLIRKRMSAYQGVRNVSFLEKFLERTKWIRSLNWFTFVSSRSSKTGPGLKIAFSLYDGKNARSINELKADQKQSFIIITAIFINNCNFLNVLYSNIFHSVPIQPWNVLIIWDLQFFSRSFVVTLWFFYGELARPGEINQFTLVSHSGLIVQSFI